MMSLFLEKKVKRDFNFLPRFVSRQNEQNKMNKRKRIKRTELNFRQMKEKLVKTYKAKKRWPKRNAGRKVIFSCLFYTLSEFVVFCYLSFQ